MVELVIVSVTSILCVLPKIYPILPILSGVGQFPWDAPQGVNMWDTITNLP